MKFNLNTILITLLVFVMAACNANQSMPTATVIPTETPTEVISPTATPTDSVTATPVADVLPDAVRNPVIPQNEVMEPFGTLHFPSDNWRMWNWTFLITVDDGVISGIIFSDHGDEGQPTFMNIESRDWSTLTGDYYIIPFSINGDGVAGYTPRSGYDMEAMFMDLVSKFTENPADMIGVQIEIIEK